MRQLTDKNFKAEVENAEHKVLVYFHAPWAGPCNLVQPNVEEAERALGNQIVFGEFCLDDNPNIPLKYGVKALPLFMLFDGGKVSEIKVGAIPTDIIKDMCDG